MLRLPFGPGRHAPVAADEVARVAAAILDDPGPHVGRTYPLHGPVDMDHYQIAAAMAGALGRPVRYEPVCIPAFTAAMRASGRPEHLVQHLASIAVDYQNGVFAGASDEVSVITGRPPMTVAAYVRAHRERFALPADARP